LRLDQNSWTLADFPGLSVPHLWFRDVRYRDRPLESSEDL
jgi:hypothetical protein